MQVEASRGPIEELDVQALAVAVFKNEKSNEGFVKKLDELSGGLVRSALDGTEQVVTANTRLQTHMKITAVIAPEADNALEILRCGCTTA